MSNRKLAKAIQTLSREIQRLYRNLNRALVNWLLRSVFVSQRRGQSAAAGFVLPLTVLLLLVLTLTVGAMTLRAFDRNTQVISESQQKTIYNAATPAIDRARSKLEFLFDSSRDTRYPGGVPSEGQLLGMMTNDGTTRFDDRLVGRLQLPGGGDPYTLPDEVRLDIGNPTGTALDGNPNNDTAWRYRADTDGDGTADATVVYSVIFKTPRPEGGASAAELLFRQPDAWKAQRGMVRGGPISNSSLTGCGSSSNAAGGLTPEAWFESGSDTSVIRKNFQVDAMVIPDQAKSAAVTLEFQQDRQIRRGNKWGAWFRNDLEIFPGPPFNWNGAMHTEGSLMLGNSNLNAYLVSSPASCLYQKESSVISVTDVPADARNNIPRYMGHTIMGLMGGRGATRAATAQIHIPPAGNVGNPVIRPINQTNDASNAAAPYDVASNAASIVLTETTRSVNPDNSNVGPNNWARLNNTTDLDERIEQKLEQVPYVDDLYRADDRYGPKAKYRDGEPGQEANWRIPDGTQSGADIPTGNPLINNDADPPAVGLDGYWERRARAEGLRVLVGERLELGNIGGWIAPRDVNGNNFIDRANPGLALGSPAGIGNLPPAPLVRATGTDLGNEAEFDGDPLYPPTIAPHPIDQGTSVPHVVQQRRSLRDNLPAVQAAAIYHAAVGNKDYPVACLASTVHPGTIDTLRQSTNFMPTSFKNGQTGENEYLLTDFFTGRGTDGWEFAPPAGGLSQLQTQLTAGQPLRIALDNLAAFAGDPDGAFPPRQEAGIIHPYPALTMWGNYSNLRRALALVDSRGYDNLSIADKTYIHTAACTIGMLAYEIDEVQKFDSTNSGNNSVWNGNPQGNVLTDLSQRMAELINGDVRDGEVLPKAKLSTYGYNANANDNLPATPDPATRPYNPRDYDNVPPEAYISALKQRDIQRGVDYLNDPAVRLAEMIMLNHQIRRDRTFGFRPSPAFGEYALKFDVNSGDPVKIFPTACDPDLFALDDPIITQVRYRTAAGRQVTPVNGMLPVVDNAAANWQFKPIPALANVTAPDQLAGAVSGDPINSLAGRRLALSRLCGAIRVPAGYDPKNRPQATLRPDGGFDPAARPVVMPKFPALYYVFPEVAHTLRGEFVDDGTAEPNVVDQSVADRAGEWDHRQPGAISANTANAITNPPVNRPNTILPNRNAAAPIAGDPAVAAGLDPYDREPYVVDAYVNRTVGAYRFRPVTVAPPTAGRLQAYPTPLPAPAAVASLNPVDLVPPGLPGSRQTLDSTSEFFSRLPYAGSSPFPTADLPVTPVVLAPRQINGFPANAQPAFLPNYAPRDFESDASPNRIQTPPVNPATATVRSLNNLPTRPWAVPFLDRALFDGRQLEVARVMDIDWGMLRQTRPAGQAAANTEFSPNEPWLPMSGVVYAFREDAVREDAIARPPTRSSIPTQVAARQADLTPGILNNLRNALDGGLAMDLRDLTRPTDPAVQVSGISVKGIDHLPDPERRPHGFRMRNGAQLKRNPATIAGIEATKNIRGLSFFTDQPVYVQGSFNLHQAGTGNENGFGELVEEFTQRLFGNNVLDTAIGNYNFAAFYGRNTKDNRFASLDNDRWRPTEILADAISILSETYCDGSIADNFVQPTGSVTNAIPAYATSGGRAGSTITNPTTINRSLYGSTNGSIPAGGLYQRGCNGQGFTSFENTARPVGTLPNGNQGWVWKREGAGIIGTDWEDFTTPIQIGRLGEPRLLPRPLSRPPTAPGPLEYLPANYGLGGLRQNYQNASSDNRGNVMPAQDNRMNAIVVSGIPPSRRDQSYGGLHNFPRFLENWGGRRFFFAGSFLQLNFSNYATGPFEQEGLEPGQVGVASPSEPIPHYDPPNRLWGYDPALQLAPAGPAAARFVTQSPNRSEFYNEPPLTDPYINRLCVAARALPPRPGQSPVNCPQQQP